MLKRGISMILIFSMIATLLLVNAEEIEPIVQQQIELTSQQKTVASVLGALGIISYDAETDLALDKPITRAEVVTLAMRAIGVDSSDLIKKSNKQAGHFLDENELNTVVNSEVVYTEFKDVPSDYWAAKNIEYAVKLGIISGYSNGAFAPEDNVSYNQALKIIVNLIGYGSVAENSGNYPTGYLLVAANKKLLNGVSTQQDFTKGDYFTLLYNALHSEILILNSINNHNNQYTTQKNRTMMSEYLRVFKGQGIISANSEVEIDGGILAGQNEVRIEDHIFQIGETLATTLIGYKTKFYARYDSASEDSTLLLLTEIEKNDVLSIEGHTIQRVTGVQTINGEVEYLDENSELQTVKLSSDAKYVYNNRRLSIITNEDFKMDTGIILLIDNNLDGLYDFLNIKVYETYLIDSISIVHETITDKLGKGTLQLGRNGGLDKTTIYKNGKKIDILDIMEWNVVEVQRSRVGDGKDIAEVTVLSNTVVGTISQIQSDALVIDDIEYEFAPSFNINSIMIGYEGTYYLDILGRIICTKKSISESFKYGFLLQVKKMNDINNKMYFRFVAPLKEYLTLELADKVNVNGQRKTFDEIEILFKTRQLVQYKLNKDNKIVEINTFAIRDDKYFDTENFSRDYVSNGAQYNNIYHRYGETYTATPNTTVFVIPKDPNNIDISWYDIGANTLLQVNTTRYDDIEVYDADENYNIGALIVKAEVSAGAGTEITTDPVYYIVKSFKQAVDNENTSCYKLTYLNFKGEEGSAFIKDTEMLLDGSWGVNKKLSEIVAGDVIDFTMDGYGYINNIAMYFDARTAKQSGEGKYLYKNFAQKKVLLGEIFVHGLSYHTFERVIRKSPMAIRTYGKTADGNKEITFNLSAAHVFVYDSARKTMKKCTVNDINQGDEIFLYAQYQLPHLVIIYR